MCWLLMKLTRALTHTKQMLPLTMLNANTPCTFQEHRLRLLANSKFRDEEIYNWTYADEQKAKREWDSSREEENPYETLPQLNLYTYQMSEIVRDKLKQGADFNDDGEAEEYAFDLNEFLPQTQAAVLSMIAM